MRRPGGAPPQRATAARRTAAAAAATPLRAPQPPRPRTQPRPCPAHCGAPHGGLPPRRRTAVRALGGAGAGSSLSGGGGSREALLFDFSDRLVPYEEAWEWQRRRVDALCGGSSASSASGASSSSASSASGASSSSASSASGASSSSASSASGASSSSGAAAGGGGGGGGGGARDTRDTVILLQHPPVYTLGAGATLAHLRFDPAAPPHPLHRTERGGEVTYHGPGQLVMYPILDLSRHTRDLHWYLRALEEVVARALAEVSGLKGERVEGLTGVWVGGAKLAAIGVRARKWVTFHGLALNVCPDLRPFAAIVPCGIGDRPVGSVRTALAAEAAAAAAAARGSSGGGAAEAAAAEAAAAAAEGGEALLREYRYALVEAFGAVFDLELAPAAPGDAARLLGAGGGASERAAGGGGGAGAGAGAAGAAAAAAADVV
ncbi:plastidial lipoyltransferase-like [Raphidocelis subcapitata]|uniref:lipoyl(octanoyl) transferase n=1 Tax=Raphidocelis subcapitata TaxID=307507 RepID=A0A2V0PNB1_9CHLO|nr:plastidial lipoyltransferase-like [Raphidocelis subcapitata]|eukprot:GBF99410.1 plastidial lipoyltransferase-like [Raphidocelis subcapitata]